MRKEMLKVFEELERKRRLLKINGKLGFDWPRPELYNKCSWVIPSKVYTIWAFSNVWKSKFAYAHAAYFLSMWKSVLFINLEVVADECLRWIIQAMYGLDYREYMNWNCELEPYENLMIRDDLYKLDDIVNCIENESADIVFIDFVQNIQVWRWSLYEQSAEIAKRIQQTAIKTKKVIYSLSQVSNATAKEINFDINDITPLKWWWEYYASSDVIFILSKEKDKSEMKIRIEKNKFWPRWEDLMFNADLSRNQFTFLKDKWDDV